VSQRKGTEENQAARLLAESQGAKRFIGDLCKTCGGYERYTSTGHCIHFSVDRDKKYALKPKEYEKPDLVMDWQIL